jgi:hypothetical protein
MRTVLGFQSFLITLITRSTLSIRNFQSLSAHRSSIHLLSPLFNEGLHIGGYLALEIHLLACRRMGET